MNIGTQSTIRFAKTNNIEPHTTIIMENVQNKTVIITGGASGIGYCITEELLRNGAKRIAIIDLPIARSHKAVNNLREKFGKERVIFFDCNITKAEYEEIFKKAVNALGGLDILVNNAGIADDNNIEGTFAINSVALIRGSLYSLNYMSQHKGGTGGTIVNIASAAGLEYTPYLPVYSASKYAVIGFSQTLKDYYDTTKVRIVTMCPHITKTAIGGDNQYLDFVGNLWQNYFKDNIIQSPEHVASAVIELIQKGENGALWSIKAGERPYAQKVQPVVNVPV